jgi:hypothetical protein
LDRQDLLQRPASPPQVAIDRARDVLARMFAEEQRLLATREFSAQQAYKWAVGGIAAAILITIGLGWLTLADAKHQFAVATDAENLARAAHQKTLVNPTTCASSMARSMARNVQRR